MAMPIVFPVQFNATMFGAGDFVVASATDGFLTPEQANATDGKTYSYLAKTADGLLEFGSGAYVYATHTQKRTTISSTSTGSLSPVNFLSPPVVSVFASPPATLEPVVVIPSGTRMLFQQSTAPVGWTKDTTHNDKALRVISGTATSGGTNNFSTVMAQTSTGNHTLILNELPTGIQASDVAAETTFPGGPVGTWGVGQISISGTGGAWVPFLPSSSFTFEVATSFNTGGTAHSHPLTMDIKYVDVIIASKN